MLPVSVEAKLPFVEPDLFLACFRICQELEDIEVRLRHGGLGGVIDFEQWTEKLASAATVQDFVSIIYGVVLLSEM